MKNTLHELEKKALKRLESIVSHDDLQKFEQEFLSKKGELSSVLRGLRDLAPEIRKEVGELANTIKKTIEEQIEKIRQDLVLKSNGTSSSDEQEDVTIPANNTCGSIHPVYQIQYELEDLFSAMGFRVLDGPQLESEYYNFDALNIPDHHPARESQDTFYIESVFNNEEKLVLRSHTSTVQVRAMRAYGAPIRAIVPGTVFRNESTDASHEHTFDQMEGLVVDKGLSISNLIAVMKELLTGMFRREVDIRLRPGFFPFVEPGFELDIKCLICGGKGCSVCKQSGWVELMPCGMVHPHVIRAGGLDPDVYSGFAFGLGLTRLVMMRYGINDIRLLRGGDIRFLEQFS